MKTALYFLAALPLASFLTGCMTHTVISRPSWYPPHLAASQFDQAQFVVYISAHGASGRAYTDRTPKTVYLALVRGEAVKTRAKLTLKAAALEWDVRWPRAGEPLIEFYDLPDGVSTYDDTAKRLRRVILTKRYRFDPKADAFMELSQ